MRGKIEPKDKLVHVTTYTTDRRIEQSFIDRCACVVDTAILVANRALLVQDAERAGATDHDRRRLTEQYEEAVALYRTKTTNLEYVSNGTCT